jgi:hypothetical protein
MTHNSLPNPRIPKSGAQKGYDQVANLATFFEIDE